MRMAFPQPFVWRNDISNAQEEKMMDWGTKYHFFTQKVVKMPHFMDSVFEDFLGQVQLTVKGSTPTHTNF